MIKQSVLLDLCEVLSLSEAKCLIKILTLFLGRILSKKMPGPCFTPY